MYKIKGFFESPNVNSLSKIIAKEIQVDSIVDENLRMIEKFADENPIMRTSEIFNPQYCVSSSIMRDNVEEKHNTIHKKIKA